MQTLGQVIIVNAPMIFNNIFQVGKAMLTVETQRKIQVRIRSLQDLRGMWGQGAREREAGGAMCVRERE
jgi:hypothetical protein